MAEDLGKAVLRLDIDDSLFRQKLADARRLIENTSVRGGRGASGPDPQDRRTATMTITRSLGERLNRLEERGVKVDRARGFLSRAALATDRKRVETARTLNRLARDFIVGEERRLNRRGGVGRMAADPINALEKAQDRRFALNRRITSLEERGVDVSRLRLALGRLTEAQSAREFENQRRQSVQLGRQIRLEEDRFKRVQSRQRLERQEGLRLGRLNSSPVTGRTPTGAIPGSPAALQEAVAEGVRRGLLNSSPVTGRTPTGPIPGSPAARAAQAAQDRRNEAERRRQQAAERRRQNRELQQGLQLGRLNAQPISGRTAAGAIPGSPAALADAISEGLRLGALNASPVSGRTPAGNIPGSPAARAAEERATRQRQQREAAAQRQLEADRRRAQAEERRRQKAIADEQKRQLDEGLRLGRLNALPVTGRTTTGPIPGSPAARAAAEAQARRDAAEQRRQSAARQRQQREANQVLSGAFSSGLIGGAFPLLFGQGVGAGLGGGFGGLIGGAAGGQLGFGLSLAGTAIGAQFDVAIQKLQTLGNALGSPIDKFQELASAGLLSSKSVERQAQALIATGREAEAAALIQADLARTYGDLTNARELAAATDELNRQWSRLTVTVSSPVLTPLTDLISNTSTALEGFALAIKKVRDALPGSGDGRGSAPPTPRQQAQAASNGILGDLTKNVVLSSPALSGFPGGVPVVFSGIRALLSSGKALKEILAPQKQSVTLSQKQLQTEARTNRLRQLGYEIINAQSFGNKELALSLEKQRIELERRDKIAALPANATAKDPRRVKIDSDAAERTYKITQEQARLQRQSNAERVAASQRIASFEDQIAISKQKNLLSGPGQQALQAMAQYREAVRAQREAQSALEVDPGNQSLISAAQVAAKAVEDAAAKTRSELIEAYQAAVDAGRQISRSAEDLQLSFLQGRTGNNGVTRFLSGQARYESQQSTFRALQPLFERARASVANSFAREGNFRAADQISSLRFSGSTAGVNQQMVDFINAARSDTRIQEDIIRTSQDLTKVNNDLALINKALSTSADTLVQTLPTLANSMATLATKDWSVQVSVASDGSSSSYGDVVNGALSQ